MDAKKLVAAGVAIVLLVGVAITTVGGILLIGLAGFGCGSDDDGAIDSTQVVISDDEITVRDRPLSPAQREIAQEIIGQGRQLGLSERDIVIAIATGYQESGLRNLNYGDRDSLGVFQQRPSQGWGTREQILHVPYAVGKFYEALMAVDNRDNMSELEVALAVQRPDPAAYSSPENRFINWLPLGLRLVGKAGDVLVSKATTSTIICAQPTPGSPVDPIGPPIGTIGDCPAGLDAGVATAANGQQLQLCTVGELVVEGSISAQVEALLADAASAGINLYGWGFRSHEDQIALRIRHCGAWYYAIWHMPPNSCNPPTAIPGESNHEIALAIDLASQYGSMGYGDPAHSYMRKNAGRFGLLEHPLEPWHWSPDGR